MDNKKNIKKEDIVTYWLSRVDEVTLSIDAREAHESCWRCGYKVTLEKYAILFQLHWLERTRLPIWYYYVKDVI